MSDHHTDIESIESRFMRMGDQIVVEPYEGEDPHQCPGASHKAR